KFGFGGIYGNTSDEFGHIGYLGEAYRAALRNRPGTFQPPIWAALPTRGKKISAEINIDYEAGDPPRIHGAAVAWQYAVGWFPLDPKDPKSPARFDTDLATERGCETMWKLSPLAGPPAPSEPTGLRQPREEEVGIGKK